MTITINKVDPVAVTDEIVKVEVEDVDYRRFIVNIDGTQYMLTSDDAYIIPSK